MKNILIVGWGSSIARETAERLQQHNMITCSRESGLAVTDESTYPHIDGPLHGLLYAPGTINLKPFGQLKESDFRSDWEINVLGLITALKKYQQNLLAEGASVVAFSTVAVQTGMPFHTSVAAAKGALEGLVRSLAAEWAPKIRVNAIAPSLTDTPLAVRLLRNEKQAEAAAERHPLKRTGKAADIAAAAAFLLSDESSWITGQVLAVDGGLSALKV